MAANASVATSTCQAELAAHHPKVWLMVSDQAGDSLSSRAARSWLRLQRAATPVLETASEEQLAAAVLQVARGRAERMKPSTATGARWRLLQSALRGSAQPTAAEAYSVMRAQRLGLLDPRPVDGHAHGPWLWHEWRAGPLLELQHLPASIARTPAPGSASKSQLVAHRTGADNTGNVTVWAAEEALAATLMSCIVQLDWAQPCRPVRVLELGAGLAGLAGWAAASAWKRCAPKSCELQLDITDGNADAAAGLRAAQEAYTRSVHACAHVATRVEQYQWGNDDPACRGPADCIVGADCLFFEHAHSALLTTLHLRLRCEGGRAESSGECTLAAALRGRGALVLFICPARGGSAVRFLQRALGWTPSTSASAGVASSPSERPSTTPVPSADVLLDGSWHVGALWRVRGRRLADAVPACACALEAARTKPGYEADLHELLLLEMARVGPAA